MRSIWLFLAVTASWLIMAGEGMTQTWTQVSSPNTNWNSVVCSADGTKLACVEYTRPGFGININWIYVSTNAGVSWSTNIYGFYANNGFSCWSSLKMSADGNIIVAVSNNAAIFVSTNFGTSWRSSFSSQFGALSPVCLSADGRRLTISDQADVYESTNSGQTWSTSTSPTSNPFTSLVCSADGRMIIANLHFAFYLSTNYGLTWTYISNRLPGTETRFVGCSSADGGKWAIGADAGLVISTNSAASWTLNYNNVILAKAIASSADGTVKFTAQAGGGLFATTNSGVTWQAITNPPSTSHYYFVACSADGGEIVASCTNGIYVSHNQPPPWINAAGGSTNLTLGWVVPSTNFVLQASPDLVSWSGLTNTPVLNFSNLQYQVNLSSANGAGFFRLSTP